MFAEPLDGARTVEGHLEEAATSAYCRQRRSAVCRFCDILNARPMTKPRSQRTTATARSCVDMVGPEIIAYPITERYSHLSVSSMQHRLRSQQKLAAITAKLSMYVVWNPTWDARRGALCFIQREITTFTMRDGRLYIVDANRAGVRER